MKPELLDGTPLELAACYPSGWIHMHIITQGLQNFIKVLKPCVDDPVVLTLDGHISRSRKLNAIELGRHHGVIIACSPPRSTHYFHPLDVLFMQPFKH
jgi:hypothetical protein